MIIQGNRGSYMIEKPLPFPVIRDNVLSVYVEIHGNPVLLHEVTLAAKDVSNSFLESYAREICPNPNQREFNLFEFCAQLELIAGRLAESNRFSLPYLSQLVLFSPAGTRFRATIFTDDGTTEEEGTYSRVDAFDKSDMWILDSVSCRVEAIYNGKTVELFASNQKEIRRRGSLLIPDHSVIA